MEYVFDEVLSKENYPAFEISKKALDDLRDEGRKGLKHVIFRVMQTRNTLYNDNWFPVVKLQGKSKNFTCDEWFDVGYGNRANGNRVSLLVDISNWYVLRFVLEDGERCRVQMVGEKKKLAVMREAIVDAWGRFLRDTKEVVYAIRN